MSENKRFDELTEMYMKPEGKSDTVRGELIRAVNRIGYRFFNDGDMLGVGYGNETCNAAGRYIGEYGSTEMVNALAKMWDETVNDSGWGMDEYAYESYLNTLIEATVKYADCKAPELDKEAENMWDYYEKEDEMYDQEDDYYEEDYEEDEWEEEE